MLVPITLLINDKFLYRTTVQSYYKISSTGDKRSQRFQLESVYTLVLENCLVRVYQTQMGQHVQTSRNCSDSLPSHQNYKVF